MNEELNLTHSMDERKSISLHNTRAVMIIMIVGDEVQ